MPKNIKKLSVYALISPGVLFLFIFVFALFTLFLMSFHESKGIGQVAPGFTLTQYFRFSSDTHYLNYLYRSLKLTVIWTLVSLVFGYATSYVMVKTGGKVREILTIMLVVQLFSVYVMRMYAVMLILGNNGIINRALISTGIINTYIKLMYNELGVGIGLFIGSVPFMVFSICSALDNIEKDVVDAAFSLGATRFQAFLKVTLPLSLPGVVSGVLLVFSWNLSSYVTPALLGGGFCDMMANFIYEQAISLQNFPMGAASSFILLFVTLLIIFLINKVFEKKIRGLPSN